MAPECNHQTRSRLLSIVLIHGIDTTSNNQILSLYHRHTHTHTHTHRLEKNLDSLTARGGPPPAATEALGEGGGDGVVGADAALFEAVHGGEEEEEEGKICR